MVTRFSVCLRHSNALNCRRRKPGKFINTYDIMVIDTISKPSAWKKIAFATWIHKWDLILAIIQRRNSYLFNSFSLFGCETNVFYCEWPVFPSSQGIRKWPREPVLDILRCRRCQEIFIVFKRPFSYPLWTWENQSFTVANVCLTPKKEKWIEQRAISSFIQNN